MKKTITLCDYCGAQIEGEPRFIMSGLEIDEDSYHKDDLDFRYDICESCFKSIRDLISTLPPKKRITAAEAAEAEAEVRQQPEEEAEAAAPAPEPAKETRKARTPRPTQKKEVDHGRIIALYTAKPLRSVAWIADDCKCSKQTVINHLTKAGIYKHSQKAVSA